MSPETRNFTMKYGGFSGFSFPLNQSNGTQWIWINHIWNDFWEKLWDNLVFSHKYPSFLIHKLILGMSSTTKNDGTVIPRENHFLFFVGKIMEHFRPMGPMNTSQY